MITFKSWLQHNGHQVHWMILAGAIEDIRKELSTKKFNRLLSMLDFQAIFILCNLSAYLAHICCSRETHPEAHTHLVNGDFVQRATSHGFSQVPVDQTIWQMLNGSTKTKGSIVEFSLRKGAVDWWIITAHSHAAFAHKCWRMTSGVQESHCRLHKRQAQLAWKEMRKT